MIRTLQVIMGMSVAVTTLTLVITEHYTIAAIIDFAFDRFTWLCTKKPSH